ncbi:MAG: HAD-IA family hydrolase [Candidatus Theseobacter exili]|nr:HAD-IA family hydrolase [Candidatus Theseobacter exili]
MRKFNFDSVVFDMDGVITKTAVVHTRAWKTAFDDYLHFRENMYNEPFMEFTDQDYLEYVDGRPRYQGVKCFLQSRNISISFGHPSDLPQKKTVCGIGNLKNRKFKEIIKRDGVEAYSSTVALAKDLKKKKIGIAVVTSSKNCKDVLSSAGIQRLFTIRIDGIVSSALGLKGKPAGDIFVTAANELGVLPERSVVVEDAKTGVQAGRNGGFGLVIGVARQDNESELLENGADVVVKDLEEVSIDWIDKWFEKDK